VSPEEWLTANGPLPRVVPDQTNRVGAVRAGSLVFVGGHGSPPGPDGTRPAGKVGRDLTVEEGYAAARSTGLSMLATLRGEIGSLDRVARIVKVLGMVNAGPGFNETPLVVDGFSDLMVEVFGPEMGRHARSAVGVAELPRDFPVEIEMIVELRPDAA
jgi:enamine deaminase RidA (YjgF/YER057c/UK114 family)